MKSLTSLSSSLLGISLQGLTDSPGSNGGVLDIAEVERNKLMGLVMLCSGDLLKTGSSPESSHVVRIIKYSGLSESHGVRSSFKMARSFSWANSSNDSILDIFQDYQIQTRHSNDDLIERRRWRLVHYCCTICCTSQVRWQSKAVRGWFVEPQLYRFTEWNGRIMNNINIEEGRYFLSLLQPLKSGVWILLFMLNLCISKADNANVCILYVQSTSVN